MATDPILSLLRKQRGCNVELLVTVSNQVPTGPGVTAFMELCYVRSGFITLEMETKPQPADSPVFKGCLLSSKNLEEPVTWNTPDNPIWFLLPLASGRQALFEFLSLSPHLSFKPISPQLSLTKETCSFLFKLKPLSLPGKRWERTLGLQHSLGDGYFHPWSFYLRVWEMECPHIL